MTAKKSIAIIIPARFASTRLPQKMLLAETGMPLILHTYLQAKKSKLATRVIIATDNLEIFNIAKKFGAEVVMTSPDHISGTDRLAEVIDIYQANQPHSSSPPFDMIINLQGDEPEVDPDHIDTLIALFQNNNSSVATLVTRFPDNQSPSDPNSVKAVLGTPFVYQDNQDNNLRNNILAYPALYFSRALIPYPIETAGSPLHHNHYFMHLGLYAYRGDFLQKFIQLPPGNLEKIEKLEQLRVLENGYSIIATIVEKAMPGIDTLENYHNFVERYKKNTSTL